MIDHISGSNSDPLADKPREMLWTREGTIDPKGRNLQRVCSFHGIIRVEEVTQLVTHAAQIIDVRPPLLVNIQPQDFTAPMPFVTKFDIDNLYSLMLGQRSRKLPHPDHRCIHFPDPRNKKSKQSPLQM